MSEKIRIANAKKCLASEEMSNRETMLRFVVSPDGVLTLDLAEKLPSRGIWFKSDKKVLSDVSKAKHFINRKYGGSGVKIPSNLPEEVATGFIKRLKDLFGLCQKAKILEVGFKKTEEAMKEGKEFQAIILATDASEASVEGLHSDTLPKTVKSLRFLSIKDLSVIADEQNCACLGLLKTNLAKTLTRDLTRYKLFLTGSEENDIATDVNSNKKAG